MSRNVPTAVRLRRESRVLDLEYEDGSRFALACELLRVYSPSAEVRGHGGVQPPPVTGRQDVNIARIEPVGNYALRLVFDDGHDTGLYTWDYLHHLGRNQERLWAEYRQRVADSGNGGQ